MQVLPPAPGGNETSIESASFGDEVQQAVDRGYLQVLSGTFNGYTVVPTVFTPSAIFLSYPAAFNAQMILYGMATVNDVFGAVQPGPACQIVALQITAADLPTSVNEGEEGLVIEVIVNGASHVPPTLIALEGLLSVRNDIVPPVPVPEGAVISARVIAVGSENVGQFITVTLTIA